MKDLIACMAEAGVSEEESSMICILMDGNQRRMDKLSLWIIDNNPTSEEILSKAIQLSKEKVK